MKKTVKTTKHMRLDKLIKYVWENNLYPNKFKSGGDFEVKFDNYGAVKFENDYVFNVNSSFAVEVEEKITKETVFDELVERYTVTFQSVIVKAINHKNSSIHDVLSKNEDTGCETLQIYTLIDNKLELIWERENQ